MSLLRGKFVKNSHIWARIYLIFLKKDPKEKLEIILISDFNLSEKLGKPVTK